MKAKLDTTVDATLLFNFKKHAQTKKLMQTGTTRGGLQEALEEAIRDYLIKYGVDPDEPLPFFAQEKVMRERRHAKETGRIPDQTTPTGVIQS